MERTSPWKGRSDLISKPKNTLNQTTTEPPKKLRKIVDSLWTSKLRYGLQLWATVRTEDTETKKNLVVEVQKAQNKLLRVLEKKRISDKIPVKSMLESQKMLSVNQLAAQIKLIEVWKAKNTEEYPIRMEFRATNENERTTRGAASGRAVETGKSHKAKSTFVGDATRLWNKAPPSVTNAGTLRIAKREIKLFCKQLPI